MAKVSAKYEVVYIVNPTKSEEETAALVAKFTARFGAFRMPERQAVCRSVWKTAGSTSPVCGRRCLVLPSDTMSADWHCVDTAP